MIFGVVDFLVAMTRYLTLYPGDVVWMGTEGATAEHEARRHDRGRDQPDRHAAQSGGAGGLGEAEASQIAWRRDHGAGLGIPAKAPPKRGTTRHRFRFCVKFTGMMETDKQDRFERFHRAWKLSLRGAERRSNLLPDERTSARQAGDCFAAPRLAMTGCSGNSTLIASGSWGRPRPTNSAAYDSPSPR